MEENNKYEATRVRPPHYHGPEEKIVLHVGGDALNKTTAAYVVYLFYKTNFLSRHVLKNMIGLLNDDKIKTGDVLKFLVEEAAKAG